MITPRPYARYRTAIGERFDLRHYDDDEPTFTEAGREWRRVVVTVGAYTSPDAAREELDRLEREAQS